MPENPLDWSIIVAAVLGSGVLSSIITTWASRDKVDAEAEKLDAESDNLRAQLEITMNSESIKFFKEYREEIGRLRDEQRELRAALRKKNEEVDNLRKEIRTLRDHIGFCEKELNIQKD